MSNYNEVTAEGVAWTRCNLVVIENGLNAGKRLSFHEQRVVTLAGKSYVEQTSALLVTFDSAATIPLVDPATNLPTGETITHAEAYRILHSAYIQAAMARDAEAVQVELVPEEPPI